MIKFEVGDRVRVTQSMTWRDLEGFGSDDIVIEQHDTGTVRRVMHRGRAIEIRWQGADGMFIVGPEVLELI